MPLFLLQTADDIVREIARLQRNYEFLSYGLVAAWIILVSKVLVPPTSSGCAPHARRMRATAAAR